MMNSQLYRNSGLKRISLKSKEFDLLLDGLSPSLKKRSQDEIHDVMGFTIVRIK